MSIQKNTVVSSVSQMQIVAHSMATELLQKQPQKWATVFGLRGDLGSGKTTFIQGFAKGLGIKEKITSPTFVIMKMFHVPCSMFHAFYHLDCYRIESADEILALGWEKIVANPENIVAVEWANKIKKIIPQKSTHLKFKFLDLNKREIIINHLRRKS